jgi:hypothetical protein
MKVINSENNTYTLDIGYTMSGNVLTTKKNKIVKTDCVTYRRAQAAINKFISSRLTSFISEA